MPFKLSSIIVASGIPGNSFCTCCGYPIPKGRNTYCMIKLPSGRSGGMWCERCHNQWKTTGKRPPAQFLACGHGMGMPIEQKAAYISFQCVECGAVTTHTRARLRTAWMQRHQSIPVRPDPKPGCTFDDPDEARELRRIDLSEGEPSMSETARCRNCGTERPIAELQQVGIGRYRKWTGLWSCRNRSRCRKYRKAMEGKGAEARRQALERGQDDV